MSIRPASRRFPSSRAVWNETNLPLCAVITPFEELEEQGNGGGGGGGGSANTKKGDAATTGTTANDGDDGANGANDSDDVDDHSQFAQPLSAVPKCLSCGAPHPTSTTHFRPSRLSSRLLCYLCGETSSTMLTDQQEIRVDEYLDPDVYDKIPFPSPSDLNNNINNRNDSDDDDDDDDDDDIAEKYKTDCIEFRVPIEVVNQRNANGRNDRNGNNNNNKHYDHDEITRVSTSWQFPAIACPPVWWIVVDGTVDNRSNGNGNGVGGGCFSQSAVQNYWTTVETTLQRALEEIPPHVHVGLITATESRLASWDLTSAVPHVKQFPFSYDPAAKASAMSMSDGEGGGDNGGEGDDSVPTATDTAWDLCLVPANGHYKANLQAAIRAMVYGAGSGVFLDEPYPDGSDDDGEEKKNNGDDDDDDNSRSTGRHMPIGLTIEILLEFMEQARHPGQDADDSDDDDDDVDDNGMTQLRYAGGKILCLLGNPPLETAYPPKDDSMSYVGQSKFGLGGVAGACHEEEKNDHIHGGSSSRSLSSKNKKKKNNNKKGAAAAAVEDDEDAGTDITDLTPSNLQDYAMPLEPEDMFKKIGSRCAVAALGVDLFVLVPEEDDYDHNKSKRSDRHYKYNNGGARQHIPWYGLPLLRPLSESSGAPGPLMFGTANIGRVEDSAGKSKSKDNGAGKGNDNDDDDSIDASEIEKFERLHENLLARTPWQTGMVFGAQMRLRLSPGYILETAAVEREPNTELQLAGFLSCGGLAGPATIVEEEEDDDSNNGKAKAKAGDDEDDDSTGLWVMGTCDSHTSFVVDLETAGTDELPDSCEMEGFGTVALKPVMQTCTMFTCVETDGAEPTPNYYTVCKMRVASVSLEFADDVESIYDALDPEAVAVVLTHKIALDAYMTGLAVAHKTAEQWLQSFMSCVYASAQAEQAKIEEAMEESKNKRYSFYDDDDGTNSNFVVGERLLLEDGEEQGDLEESDVLMGQGHHKVKFIPLLIYAIIQCDALRPCGGSFQPSMDARLCALTQMASMTPTALAKTIAPSLSLWSLKDDEPIMESIPLSREGILSAMEDLAENSDNTEENTILLLESPQRVILFRIDDLDSRRGGRGPRLIKIGSELKAAIFTGLTGFRTAPPQWKGFERILDNNGGDLNDVQVSPSVLRSMLVEDKGTASAISGNSGSDDSDFIEWKLRMAESIRELVEEEDERQNEPRRGLLRRFLPF